MSEFFSGFFEASGWVVGEVVVTTVFVGLLSAIGLSKDDFINHVGERIGRIFRRGHEKPAGAGRRNPSSVVFAMRFVAWLAVVIITGFLAVMAFKPAKELNGRIDWVLLGDIAGFQTPAVLEVTVVNGGDRPSAVFGWSVVAEKDGHKYIGQVLRMPGNLGTNQGIGLSGKNDWTLNLDAIPVGGLYTGFLFVEFDKMNDTILPTAKFTVRYMDAQRTHYTLIFNGNGVDRSTDLLRRLR